MRQFEFDHANQQWDNYKAFHKINGPFVEFADGALMVNQEPDPYARKFYEKYGIELVSTAGLSSSTYGKKLYFDEAKTEPVHHAWLNTSGQQLMAIDIQQNVAVKISSSDIQQNVAVKISSSGKDGAINAPRNMHGIKAHWSAFGRDPVSNTSFFVSRPDAALRKLMTVKLAEVRAAVTAAYRIQGATRKHWGVDTAITMEPSWEDMSVADIVAWAMDPKSLSYNNRAWRIAHKGFQTPRRITTHHQLYI